MLKKILNDMYNVKEVAPDFISKLVNKYDTGEKYTEDELINCYCIENGKYITCFNISGDCYIEEFKRLNTVFDYFTSEKDLETLYIEDDVDNITNCYCTTISVAEINKVLTEKEKENKKTGFLGKLFKKRAV